MIAGVTSLALTAALMGGSPEAPRPLPDPYAANLSGEVGEFVNGNVNISELVIYAGACELNLCSAVTPEALPTQLSTQRTPESHLGSIAILFK